MFQKLSNKSEMYIRKNKYYMTKNLKKKNINNFFINGIIKNALWL